MPTPGYQIRSATAGCFLRRCHECNAPVGNKDLFCPRCGAKLRREKIAPASLFIARL
jgi:rRNA maturation endonuclease Nob1